MFERLFRLFSRGETRSYTAAPYPFGLPATQIGGIVVTPASALTMSAVWCAVNAISTDIAQLPFLVYRRTAGGGRVEDPNHVLFDLLDVEPNPDLTAFQFERTLVAHTLLHGNGYAEIARDYQGTPRALYLLDPRTTVPERAPDNRLVYRIQGRDRPLLSENVLHLAGLGYDGVKGYSPITLARQSIELGINSETFGASFYRNSAVPHGFLKFPGTLSPEAQKNVRESLNDVHGGPVQAHRIGLLEGGMDWIQTSVSPENAQFLATREFQVIEICRWFNISPIRLQDYSHATYSNVEQASLDYVNTTLAPWVEAIENEWTRKLLTREERRVWVLRHDFSSRLRADKVAQGNYYRQLFAVGALSINEIRASEDMNAVDGGDKHYVPLNMYAIEDGPPQAPEPGDNTPDPGAPALDPPGPEVDPTAGSEFRSIARTCTREVVLDAVGRMVRREVEGLRTARRKHDPTEAVSTFLGKQERVLGVALSPALAAWNGITGSTLDPGVVARDWLADTRKCLAHTPSEAVDDLIAGWEETRAENLVERITGNGVDKV